MKLLLGVTGCIAAYKSAELLRLLQKQGYEVHVVMTENAQRFITPLTLAALSQNRVLTRMYAEEDSQLESKSTIEHIEAAHSADALLVAPATANTLAKFANGIADDFLSTLYLAITSPVIIAPAMNIDMWHHPAVKENVRRLRSEGVNIIEPEEGYLAEGIFGKGRLASLDTIVDTVRRLTHGHMDFVSETVLVTAGPTHEDIDPVRYITNRSSGKMGYKLAYAFQMRGARTILVSGPTHLEPPVNVEFIPVRSAVEMREKVLHYFSQATIVVKAAAVADFRPRETASQKIKKNGTTRCLELVPTPDILSDLGKQKAHRILVGFAAETENVLENAREKLKRKNLDLLVVNDVTREGAGFNFDTNVVTILTRDGKELHLEKKLKLAVAHEILDQIIALKHQHV